VTSAGGLQDAGQSITRSGPSARGGGTMPRRSLITLIATVVVVGWCLLSPLDGIQPPFAGAHPPARSARSALMGRPLESTGGERGRGWPLATDSPLPTSTMISPPPTPTRNSPLPTPTTSSPLPGPDGGGGPPAPYLNPTLTPTPAASARGGSPAATLTPVPPLLPVAGRSLPPYLPIILKQ